MGLIGGAALVVFGAILLWGVDGSLGGVDVSTIGAILMVVGALGGFLALVVSSRSTRLTGARDSEEERLTTLPR